MNNKILLGGVIVAVALFIGYIVVTDDGVNGYGTITSETPAVQETVREYNFFTATTSSTVSTDVSTGFDAQGRYDAGWVSVAGAEKVSFIFGRGDTTGEGNTGLSVFSVEGTQDGTNWESINRLIQNDLSGTATSTFTINAATSTDVVSLDMTHHTWLGVRCRVTETTDGEHSCDALIEY